MISSNTPQQQTRLFDLCKDKPFWIWDAEKHKQEDIDTKGYCCSITSLGWLPKEALKKPLFGYERLLYDSLFFS
jgi:hypothetical protein